MTPDDEILIKSKEIKRLRNVCHTKDDAIQKAIDHLKAYKIYYPPSREEDNTALVAELETYLG